MSAADRTAHRRAEDYSPPFQSGNGPDVCPCCWKEPGGCCHPKKAQVSRWPHGLLSPEAQEVAQPAFACRRSPALSQVLKRSAPTKKLRTTPARELQPRTSAPLSSITPSRIVFDREPRLFVPNGLDRVEPRCLHRRINPEN